MKASTSKYAICRHIKTNGRRCQSPALTGQALCFFHRNLYQTHRRPETSVGLTSSWQESSIDAEGTAGHGEEDPFAVARVYPKQNEICFPALEDAESVQLATSMLFQAIATGQIHFKRARMLLYALKIACINQRALDRAKANFDSDPAAESATRPTRVVRTTQGHTLAAPDEDLEPQAAPPEPLATPTPTPAAAPAQSPTQIALQPRPVPVDSPNPPESFVKSLEITILAASALDAQFYPPTQPLSN